MQLCIVTRPKETKFYDKPLNLRISAYYQGWDRRKLVSLELQQNAKPVTKRAATGPRLIYQKPNSFSKLQNKQRCWMNLEILTWPSSFWFALCWQRQGCVPSVLQCTTHTTPWRSSLGSGFNTTENHMEERMSGCSGLGYSSLISSSLTTSTPSTCPLS